MGIKPWFSRAVVSGFVTLLVGIFPSIAFAAGAGAPHLEGKDLGLVWVIPFACMLLSIAIFPLVAPHFWHKNFGKVSGFWAVCFLIPFTIFHGYELALYETLHVGLLEYFPFIILLFSLFTVAGGVRVRGKLTGTPVLNTIILLIGTTLASFMGTTGAAMLLIRPLIRAMEHRKHKTHTVVFFIFLVANIGGSLTPLGDPPLFLGFLKGVDFFWPTVHMFLPMLFLSIVLLLVYFALDSFLYSKEGPIIVDPATVEPADEASFALDGKVNLLLLVGVVAAVLMSGVWKPSISFNIYHVHVEIQNLVRDAILLFLAYLSLRFTNDQSRKENGFNWFPILEVGKLFIGIFITIIPAIAILKAGTSGALGMIVESVSTSDGQPVNYMYFWATGILSSFLDNAPTYLVFFNTTGSDVATLTGELSNTLLAISAGAVFMGANTYVGNAPNFMVRSIAEESGVPMPSFFGYMLWSGAILIPCFVVLTFIFFI